MRVPLFEDTLLGLSKGENNGTKVYVNSTFPFHSIPIVPHKPKRVVAGDLQCPVSFPWKMSTAKPCGLIPIGYGLKSPQLVYVLFKLCNQAPRNALFTLASQFQCLACNGVSRQVIFLSAGISALGANMWPEALRLLQQIGEKFYLERKMGGEVHLGQSGSVVILWVDRIQFAPL